MTLAHQTAGQSRRGWLAEGLLCKSLCGGPSPWCSSALNYTHQCDRLLPRWTMAQAVMAEEVMVAGAEAARFAFGSVR